MQEWALDNGVEILDWPPYSPDLNPIENVWSLLKERICKKYPNLAGIAKNNKSKRLLVRAAINIWESFGEDELNSLMETMVNRLEAVVEAKGWYTKY